MTDYNEIKKIIKQKNNIRFEPLCHGDVFELSSCLFPKNEIDEQLCNDFYTLYESDPELLKISISPKRALMNLAKAVPTEIIEDFYDKLGKLLGERLLAYPEVIELINEKMQVWHDWVASREETKSNKRG